MLGRHRSARWCLLTEEKYFVCSTVKQNRNCSCDMHVNLPFYSSRIVETCVWQTRYVSTIYTLFLEVASFTGIPGYMLWPLWKFLNLAVHQPLGKMQIIFSLLALSCLAKLYYSLRKGLLIAKALPIWVSYPILWIYTQGTPVISYCSFSLFTVEFSVWGGGGGGVYWLFEIASSRIQESGSQKLPPTAQEKVS